MGNRDRFQAVLDKLLEKDYKLTPQRRIVVETFVENADKHLSAEDVYNLVKGRNPDIGLATVYRTLDLLAELGVLQKINFGDGRSRFEFGEDLHHHHHMVCIICHTVTEFGEDFLDQLEEEIGGQTGFKVLDHELKFFGICAQCQEKEAAGDEEAEAFKQPGNTGNDRR